MLVADKHSLALRGGVMIDVHVVGDWAARLIAGCATSRDLAALPDSINSLELLPGWCDDWVVLERERLRQRLLHALEALSRAHWQAGRGAQAIEAALVAVNGYESYRDLLPGHQLSPCLTPRTSFRIPAGAAARRCRVA